MADEIGGDDSDLFSLDDLGVGLPTQGSGISMGPTFADEIGGDLLAAQQYDADYGTSNGTAVGLSPTQVRQQYLLNPPANQPVNNFAGGLLGAAGQILGGALVPVTGTSQAGQAAALAAQQQAKNRQLLILGVAALVGVLLVVKLGR